MENRDKDRDRTDEQSLESPLGIAGTPVTPDAPDHLRASNDEAEARRRRNRAIGEAADPATPGSGMADTNFDHKGATGIDLGADRGTK